MNLTAGVLVEPCKEKTEHMGYLHDTDAWLHEQIWTVIEGVDEGGEDVVDGFKKEIKEKILQSYHSGQREVIRMLGDDIELVSDELREQLEGLTDQQKKYQRRKHAPKSKSRRGRHRHGREKSEERYGN